MVPEMFRICLIYSKKPVNFTFFLYTPPIQNFSSTLQKNEAVNDITKEFGPVKLWKRVKKSNPQIKSILQLPESVQRISELTNLMKCDEDVVKELISRDSCILASNVVLEKIKLLQYHGFTADDIVASPSVLHRSLVTLERRLQIVEAMSWTHAKSLHLIKQPNKVFELFIERCRDDIDAMKNFTSREQFLADLFQCDEKVVLGMIESNDILLSISPALIRSKVNALAKYKIGHGYIRENLRILIHTSAKELDRRCALLYEKQLLNSSLQIKLGYLLSCNSQEFSKSFSYLCKRKEALEGCRDKLEYISYRLQCSESVAKYFLSSRSVSKLSEMKLKQILDFLLQEVKMEANCIMRHKGMFYYSIERLRDRWAVLCNAGCKDISMLPSAVVLPNKKFSAKYGSFVFVDTFNVPEE